ncbi:hypothetical protein [Pseudoduganella sp. R-34]|uniref:hypothetical protein n=1 Tax=Pseudoduganella sp. R-34 TaxID=3404062 RepID=UPI003CF086A7
MKTEFEEFVKGQSKFTRPAYSVGIAAGAYLAYAGPNLSTQVIGATLLALNLYGLWISCK